jgi:hypothetical protein
MQEHNLMIKMILKTILLVSVIFTLSVSSRAETSPVPLPQVSRSAYELVARKSNYQGDVFLLRGFADIFSLGLDEMGAKLNARGIKAQVIRHTSWRYAALTIIANQKKYGRVPVVLIGHSLGANAIIRIADYLKKHRIIVQYLVTFEPTRRLIVPSNVSVAVNYYLSNSSMGLPLEKARGSRGKFVNKNMIAIDGIGHFNIEKQAALQRSVINRVLFYVKPLKFKKSAQLLQ